MNRIICRILRQMARQKTPRKEQPAQETPEEEKYKTFPAEYSVPSPLNAEGFYAVQMSQVEVYDARRYPAFISHLILYDRKGKIAVDVTSGAEVIDRKGVDCIEKYLTGEVKPEFSDFPEGVKCFKVRELNDMDNSLREKMAELRVARLTLDSTVDALKRETSDFRTRFFPR